MPDIRHCVQISAASEAVFPLVASSRGMAEWWAEDVRQNGDTIELGFFNRTTVYKLKSQLQRPNSRTEWRCESGDEWGGTHLIFEVEPAGKGTLLRFTHAGWRDATDYFISCTTTWGELMYRLKSAAEGKSRGPCSCPAAWPTRPDRSNSVFTAVQPEWDQAASELMFLFSPLLGRA
jgi:uncharacterized protein YndB with AHSA1/START domain